ncbi:hypothetical protein [Fodinicurvata fenggangensis]|uniref:hypothetical protein n=1 Tax=Fodinicurvata fenggangensis TaxID=1121830 RepID=UPI000A920B92|nr:hypothetical protein [Fodinicurvata fenggangensis]
MAKEKQKSNAWVPLLFIGGFVLYAIGSGGSDDEKDESRYDADGCLPAEDAFFVSQQFVERSLKAPSTAEFSSSFDRESGYHKTGACTYRVSGYVDAENSFGAKIRTNWWTEVEYSPEEDGWRLLDMTTDE